MTYELPESFPDCLPSSLLPLDFTAYDNTEVHPVKLYTEGSESWYDTCDPTEADLWTLYGHFSLTYEEGFGIIAWHDFHTEEEAEFWASYYKTIIEQSRDMMETFK